MIKSPIIVLIGLSLVGFLGPISREAAGQDIDAKIKKLEELEARLDAKLERLEKLEKLDALQARIDAKLKRLEEIDRELESGLQPVAARSGGVAREGGDGMRGRPLTMSAPLSPAEYPMFEIFGGGQYSNIGILGGRRHAFGWDGRVGVNFHRNFGIVADFGGAYGSANFVSCNTFFSCGSKRINFSAYHLGFGPQLTVRDELLNAFFHIPLGFVRSKAAGLKANYDFSLSPGVGLDINFGKSVAYRLLELDYIGVNSKTTGWTNHFRAQTGLVYRFGY